MNYAYPRSVTNGAGSILALENPADPCLTITRKKHGGKDIRDRKEVSLRDVTTISWGYRPTGHFFVGLILLCCALALVFVYGDGGRPGYIEGWQLLTGIGASFATGMAACYFGFPRPRVSIRTKKRCYRFAADKKRTDLEALWQLAEAADYARQAEKRVTKLKALGKSVTMSFGCAQLATSLVELDTAEATKAETTEVSLGTARVKARLTKVGDKFTLHFSTTTAEAIVPPPVMLIIDHDDVGTIAATLQQVDQAKARAEIEVPPGKMELWLALNAKVRS